MWRICEEVAGSNPVTPTGWRLFERICTVGFSELPQYFVFEASFSFKLYAVVDVS
jgi:hypothetical protein